MRVNGLTLLQPLDWNVLTLDPFKDYLCNLITMMGSIVLAVNFLASMGTGPVNCMLKSKYHSQHNASINPLLP